MKLIFTMATLLFSLHCFALCSLPAPLSLKPSNIISCQFEIKWKSVPGATKYNIQYKESSSSNWISMTSPGDISSFTITGLSPDLLYMVKIAAICLNNETGTFSNPISVKTLACTIPTNITTSAVTSTSATITWSTTCNVTKYTARYKKKRFIWLDHCH